MNWDKIIGQEKAVQYIKDIYAQDRIPHAIIIGGPQGTGQLALALGLSELLQCTQPKDNQPCGQCNACHKSGSLIHPDINFIFPVAPLEDKQHVVHFYQLFKSAIANSPYLTLQDWTKAAGIENKKPNINVHDIGTVIQQLTMSRYEGRKRIMIIWLPEFLDKEGNKLLKIIEEPEPNTHILLVTENRDRILPTILSRCQQINTLLLEDDFIVNLLMEQHHASPDIARQIALLAEGRISLALSQLHSLGEESSSDVLSFLRICYKGNGAEIAGWADTFNAMNYEGQRHFLHYCLHFLQQCLRALHLPEDLWRFSATEKQAAKNLLQLLDHQKIESIARLLSADIGYLAGNANSKMLMMSTSIRTHRILRGN